MTPKCACTVRSLDGHQPATSAGSAMATTLACARAGRLSRSTSEEVILARLRAPRSGGAAGVAGAGFAVHRSRAEIVHRLSARVAAHRTVVSLQLVDLESGFDLPRLLRLVLHGESVRRVRPVTRR